jgi:hypothetical protein
MSASNKKISLRNTIRGVLVRCLDRGLVWIKVLVTLIFSRRLLLLLVGIYAALSKSDGQF